MTGSRFRSQSTLVDCNDVAVVGGGLVGLASAAALAEAGCSVLLIAPRHAGQASAAAAGILAPGAERPIAAAHDFFIRARERYPSYLEWLAERAGMVVTLDRSGALELANSPERAEALRSAPRGDAVWVTPSELATLDPSLHPGEGAMLYSRDGWVDNRRLLDTLQLLIAGNPRVSVAESAAAHVDSSRGLAVLLEDGSRHSAGWIVLAAGAWTPAIGGIPRRLPVEPVRGQMIALGGASVTRVTFVEGGYLVPRPDGRTLVGSTMERVGFDCRTTPNAIAHLRELAVGAAPVLGTARVLASWAGLRPVTPDLLPILGADPDQGRLIYACGHSRNGVLLSPLTGDCVAALVTGAGPPADLTPFRPGRPALY